MRFEWKVPQTHSPSLSGCVSWSQEEQELASASVTLGPYSTACLYCSKQQANCRIRLHLSRSCSLFVTSLVTLAKFDFMFQSPLLQTRDNSASPLEHLQTMSPLVYTHTCIFIFQLSVCMYQIHDKNQGFALIQVNLKLQKLQYRTVGTLSRML